MSRKTKRAQRHTLHDQRKTNIVELDQYREKPRRISAIPRNLKQEDYVAALEDHSKAIVIAIGPAGSGKTLLATQYSLKALWEGTINKIVITRPSLPSEGEDLGFLPGNMIEKMLPWTRPIIDILSEYYAPKEIQRLIENEVVELAPIAFIRGRTLKNCWIIADECQNLSTQAFKSLITRIGDNSRMIITGDLAQTDRGSDNGLADFMHRLSQYPVDTIAAIRFQKGDIQRHPVIKDILHLYNEE